MKCTSCGSEIPDGVKFCPACGASQPEAPAAAPVAPPAQPQYSYQAPAAAPAPVVAKPKTTGMIVFSIVNMLCCGGLFGLIALIFSILAGSAATFEDGRQKLKVAKILNIIGVVLGVVMWIVIIAIYGVVIFTAIRTGNWSNTSGY